METKKILDPSIELVAHCVRIPVFIDTARPCSSRRQADDGKGFRDLLREAPGVTVIDHRATKAMSRRMNVPARTLSSRIRGIPPLRTAVFWCVSDNLRKGAALNSVQIAELVAERGLSGR